MQGFDLSYIGVIEDFSELPFSENHADDYAGIAERNHPGQHEGV